jgi:integrase
VIRWLSDEEEKRLRAVMAKHYPAHMPELVISLGTGMRLTEQYQLRWKSVDFKRREVRLSTTKNYSGRAIPMNSEVFSAFEQLRKQATSESGRVFQINNPRKRFERALRLAEITKFRWHDCRHTFSSRLAMKNVNLKAIQMLAGHKTIAITARYAHLNDAALRAAVDCLTNIKARSAPGL